jgi:hypothetical protein
MWSTRPAGEAGDEWQSACGFVEGLPFSCVRLAAVTALRQHFCILFYLQPTAAFLFNLNFIYNPHSSLGFLSCSATTASVAGWLCHLHCSSLAFKGIAHASCLLA